VRAAIDLICRKLASSEFSHQAAWAHLRANQLRSLGRPCEVLDQKIERLSKDWSEYDIIYVYHGMDYRPGPYLNVFDGMAPHAAKFFERLAWPQHDHIKYISVDLPMPPYGRICKIKKGTQSDYWKNVDWDNVQKRCEGTTEWFKDPCLSYDPDHKVTHLTIGDSHAFSVYRPLSGVIRKDGRTLRGVLRKSIQKEIADYGFDLNQIKSLTCYWGSIDVRHHLCQESNPTNAAKDLLKLYEDGLKSLEREIELVTILPIEDESRTIPKSGHYKGQPFWGSRLERINVLNVMNDGFREIASRNGWTIFEWPQEWYECDGVEFFETYMERPRSVHLARRYYRWDLANNVPNPYLESKVKGLLEF
jgi:hypothetical protein